MNLRIPRRTIEQRFVSPRIGDLVIIKENTDTELYGRFVIYSCDPDTGCIMAGRLGNPNYKISLTIVRSNIAIVSSNQIDVVSEVHLGFVLFQRPEEDAYRPACIRDGQFYLVMNNVIQQDPPEEGFGVYIGAKLMCSVTKADGSDRHGYVPFRVVMTTDTFAVTSITIHNDLYGVFDMYPESDGLFMNAARTYVVTPIVIACNEEE